MRPILQLTDVSKSFGAVRALNGVSFEVKPGEVHALLGENGAGKSTLIKVITGAHQADEGTIAVNGEVVGHVTPAKAHKLGIACIYQQPALFPDLTVAENVALRIAQPRAFQRLRRHEQERHADELLARIGANIPADKEVRALSMPEQQLVEIACAIGAGARVVIMDEPTASLTKTEQELLFRVVRDLRAQGIGVIYISHRLEEIFALADRVTVLRDGGSVGTFPIGELNEAQLISLMVGREVTRIYPASMSAGGEGVLSLKDVSCEAGGIRNVSFDVRSGEIVGLAGLVGAGRTELARVIFGITPADAGEIRLGGEAVKIRAPQEAVAHGIGYVPEDRRRHGVILEMPIAENMTMAIHRAVFPGGRLRFAAEEELAQRFMALLGIKAYGPEAPGSALSGGNQQKVSLARWLATKPKLLIVDEPTQGVDVGAKSEIHRILRELARDGLAVLMISSDLPEILGMSDRVAVMRGGTVVEMIEKKDASAERVMAAALGQRGRAAA